jgi:hypothetical protein
MNKIKKNCKMTLFSIFLFFLGCEFNPMAHLNSPLIVKIPWKQKGEAYFSLQSVELKTINRLSPLDGYAANIFIRPEIFDDHISGDPAEIKFTYNSKKEIIPLNRLSSQALTLYAHMERLYLWSSKLNIPSELKLKLDVGLAAEFLLQNTRMKNNALFSSSLNSLLVVPYTNEVLPLSLNGGVLAHEYFHFLFNGLKSKFIIDHLPTINPGYLSPHEKSFGDDNKLENKDLNGWLIYALTRGMNEGLADVWGWLYSEDTNFIVTSLPYVSKTRDLEAKPKTIWTKNQMVSVITVKADMHNAAESLAYDLGTEYARWFYSRITEVEGTQHLTDEQRDFWSNKIVERLAIYMKRNMSLKDSSKMIPSDFITFLLFGDEKLSESECLYWSTFVEKSERDMAFSRNCSARLFHN